MCIYKVTKLFTECITVSSYSLGMNRAWKLMKSQALLKTRIIFNICKKIKFLKHLFMVFVIIFKPSGIHLTT